VIGLLGGGAGVDPAAERQADGTRDRRSVGIGFGRLIADTMARVGVGARTTDPVR